MKVGFGEYDIRKAVNNLFDVFYTSDNVKEQCSANNAFILLE